MQKRCLIKQNSGFTLIELIVSMLVSSVVILSAVLFLSVCLNTYRDTAQETDVMMESQIAVNVIREVLMEAKESVEIGNCKKSGTEYRYFVVKTAPGLSETDASVAEYEHLFVHDKPGKHLLYFRTKKSNLESAESWIENVLLLDGKVDKSELSKSFLADYVYSISLKELNQQLYRLVIEFECGKSVYHTEEIISVRNTLDE